MMPLFPCFLVLCPLLFIIILFTLFQLLLPCTLLFFQCGLILLKICCYRLKLRRISKDESGTSYIYFYRMLFYNSSPARVYRNMGYTGYKGRLFFCQPLFKHASSFYGLPSDSKEITDEFLVCLSKFLQKKIIRKRDRLQVPRASVFPGKIVKKS